MTEETIKKTNVVVDINNTQDNESTKINIEKLQGKELNDVNKTLLGSVTIEEGRVKKIFTKRLNIYIFAIICTFLWASAYPTIRLGYDEFHVNKNDLKSVFLFAGIRFTLSGIMIILGYWVVKKKIVLPSKKLMPDIIALGIITVTIQYIVFYAGVGNTTGVKNSVFNSCNTFFTVIIAHFLFKNDRITVPKAVGCAIGFLGVIIINLGFDFFLGRGKKFEFGFTLNGEGLILMNCLISSIGNVLVKIINNTGSLFKWNKFTKEEKGKKKVDIILITGYQMLFGAVLIDIFALIWIFISPPTPVEGSLDKPYTSISILGYLLMFHMGLISAVAFPIWNTLLKFNNVGKISFFNFLIPVFGTFLSGILLGENLFKIENLVSLILVCIGVIIVC
ncbi:DUF6-domain-containing protein [Neocallimastix lanati (nom. inval.)]|jgi:drug/metabolite transporter (DMT)-like permease|uniref:DUF6-domain-containing protein n=1 Tax=Neocallimastix californiae TaxID=1754190 RepID=A0A1Y2E056_9FUNG|nr:DUF6-domain-containing protein [Neocallimastix sp. JGI-2020a]ORY64726.1 DUF6-domain-containing protein [Neocallimastix californiae]|eukprot:ORY64726.1 DUF6-domain-containing protein [Neocallimastix californiae]